MKIPFLYGKREIVVTCPEENVLAVVAPGSIPEAGDEVAMVRDAVRNPIGAKRLSQIAKPGDTVAIVTDDHARPIVGWKIVPTVLEELRGAGVHDEDITIIMGSGTHRPCTPEEMERLLGREVTTRYRVVNHNMDDKDNLVFLGMTSRGNAVWVNRVFARADVKVLTGQIGIISFGFSGGRKSVLPAVSGRDTIYFNHRHEWITKAHFGCLENNVMHDDALEAGHLAKVDFIVNVVLNLKQKVIKAVAGDMVAAWMEGVKCARQHYTVPLERRPEIVITSAGGSPGDDTMFQALKGYQQSYLVMKRGGCIILVADCPNGVGDKELDRFLRMDPDEFFKRVEAGEPVHFMADILHSGRKKASEIFLKSSLPPQQVKEFGFVPVESVEEAIEKALAIQGKDAKILCLPKGTHVAPVVSEGGMRERACDK
jgi:nickel-dependent lactate racemase